MLQAVRAISGRILARLTILVMTVCSTASEIRAVLAGPVDEAPTTETMTAAACDTLLGHVVSWGALNVTTTLLNFEDGGTLWTSLEGVVHLFLDYLVDRLRASLVLVTGLANVLWTIAIEASLEFAVLACEHPAVDLAVERLESMDISVAILAPVLASESGTFRLLLVVSAACDQSSITSASLLGRRHTYASYPT